VYISYFDESGDDGYPLYSSEIFILTSIYFHHSQWKENYDKILRLRKYLKTKYGIPIKQELHTKDFLLDKGFYHNKFSPEIRKEILFLCCKFIKILKLKIINVCIDKTKIKRPQYDVLNKALTYNVQRIENDMHYTSGDAKFLIITDEGRVSKMTKTTRAIQRINYIPSHFTTTNYRKEIVCLIEDPLPKNSTQSYYIQLSDMISYVVNLYVKQNVCNPKIEWAKRIRNVLGYGDEIALMNLLKPNINLKANKSNEFGVVCYPK